MSVPHPHPHPLRKPIDRHALDVLEFQAVCELLAEHATSALGRAEALTLQPSGDAGWITRALGETAELRGLLDRAMGGETPAGPRDMIAWAAMREAREIRSTRARNGRPVLAVKANYRQRVPGVVLDRSASGATLYVEPHTTIELSNELEDRQHD